MRVLLDSECAAVAGGQESKCVRRTTLVGMATGGVIGGVAGAAAGGVGAIPGAGAGTGIGGSVAYVVAPTLCNWFGGEESEEEEVDYVDPEIEDWSNNRYAAWNSSRTGNGLDTQRVYAPHEYVADGASY